MRFVWNEPEPGDSLYKCETGFSNKYNIAVESINLNNDCKKDVAVRFKRGGSTGTEKELRLYENITTVNPVTGIDSLELKFRYSLNLHMLADLNHCICADFNGDNVTEFLRVYNYNTSRLGGFIGYLDKQNNFQEGDNCFPPDLPAIYDPFDIVCADFSGDGLLDLAFFTLQSVPPGMNVMFLVSDKTTGLFSKIVAANNIQTQYLAAAAGIENHILTGDFYGDGKASILYCPGGDPNFMNFSYNYLIKLDDKADMIMIDEIDPISNDNGYCNLLTGDFNGDSKTDVARLDAGPCKLDILLSDGNGGFITTGPFTLTGAGSNWNNYGITAADLNNDGCCDFSMMVRSAQYNYQTSSAYYYTRKDILLQLTGSNTLNYKVVDFSWFVDSTNVSAYQRPLASCYGNFTGNNNNTLLTVTTTHPHHLFVLSDYNQNISNRMITSFINSFGDSTEVTYKPLSYGNVAPVNYSIDTFPLVPDLSARNVVAGIRKNYGGKQSDSRVWYGTGWIHTLGKGFLGFSHLGIENLAEGSYTGDYNTIVRPFFAPVTYQKKYNVKANAAYKPASVSKYKYSFSQAGKNKSWRYTADVVEVSEETYTENTALFNVKKTSYSLFDDYHLPKKVRISYSADGSNYLQSEEHAMNYRHINTEGRYILGLKEYDSVKHTSSGTDDINHLYQYQYYPNTSLLQTLTSEPGTAFQLTATYTYDDFGNLKSSTAACSGYPSRTDSTIYSPDGRFLTRLRNAQGQATTFACDPVTGLKSTSTDPNGLTTSYFYDSFGNLVKTVLPDGRNSVQVHRWVGTTVADAPAGALFYTWSKTSGAPAKKVFYNKKGQIVRESAEGAMNQLVIKDYEYYSASPNAGLLYRESNPYFYDNGSSPPNGKQAEVLWTKYVYNCKHEPWQITRPDGSDQTTYTSGRTLRIDRFDGFSTKKEFNGAGWLTKVTDNNSETIDYTYTAEGYPQRVTTNGDAAHAISYRYNPLGKVDSVQDPHLGKVTYRYSPYGDVIRHTNARNQATNISYDKLGRPTVSSSPEGVARWYYDSQPYGAGQPAYSRFTVNDDPNGTITKNYYYDEQGRLIRSSLGIGSDTSSYSYAYDLYGNMKKTTSPSGFVVLTEYDQKGFTSKITNPDYGTLWKLNAQDPFGNVTGSESGGVYSSNRFYNPRTDRLNKIRLLLKSSGTLLYEGNYGWNLLGNMTRRTDSLRGLEETFHYTALNQLDKTYLNGTLTSNITYGDLGNFDTRSDVGTFTYGENNAGPQAVTGIQTQSGVFPSAVQTVKYTSFEKIKEITESPRALKVLYDEAGQKLLQTITNSQTLETTTTRYQGFSEKVTGSGTVKTTDYIASPEGVIAIFTRNGNTDSTLHFIVKDYAGSMIGIMNPNGTYAQEMNFDAWGRRRDPATWQSFSGTAPQALYTRGYTMHEHLANFGLIDMKGRVYDPLVGRFLSPDPFIQAPEFSLSFNRYSYCLNNPLLYSDPTGFFAEAPDIDYSGPDYADTDNDLGSANSTVETACNTVKQTDWVTDKPGQEPYFDKNVTGKDDPDLNNRIYVGKTFWGFGKGGVAIYGDENGRLFAFVPKIEVFGFRRSGGAFNSGMERSMNSGYDPNWWPETKRAIAGGYHVINVLLDVTQLDLMVRGLVGEIPISQMRASRIGASGSSVGEGMTRVGRWMSETEYTSMKSSGNVLEGAGGQTFVTTGGPDAFTSAAKGSVYVEFDVPTSSLLQGGQANWFKVIGPNAGRAMQSALVKQGGEFLPQIQNLSPILQIK